MKKLTVLLITIVFMLVCVNSVFAGNPMAEYGKKRTVITAAEWKAERDAKNKIIEKTNTNSEIKQISIKVRGLYIGMSFDNAVKLYEQKLNQKGDVFKARKVESGWMYGGIDSIVFIEADSNKIVNKISLDQTAHFNAGGFSTKDFVIMFSKKYKKSFKYAPISYSGYIFDYYQHENSFYTISIGQGNITLEQKADSKKITFD